MLAVDVRRITLGGLDNVLRRNRSPVGGDTSSPKGRCANRGENAHTITNDSAPDAMGEFGRVHRNAMWSEHCSSEFGHLADVARRSTVEEAVLIAEAEALVCRHLVGNSFGLRVGTGSGEGPSTLFGGIDAFGCEHSLNFIQGAVHLGLQLCCGISAVLSLDALESHGKKR